MGRLGLEVVVNKKNHLTTTTSKLEVPKEFLTPEEALDLLSSAMRCKYCMTSMTILLRNVQTAELRKDSEFSRFATWFCIVSAEKEWLLWVVFSEVAASYANVTHVDCVVAVDVHIRIPFLTKTVSPAFAWFMASSIVG